MPAENDSIKELLESNQALLTSLDKRLQKIERKFKWDSILGIVKWTVIVLPIVLGVIWISPYVRQYASYLEPAIKLLHLDGLASTNTNVVPDQDFLSSFCDSKQRALLVNQYCK